MRVCFSSAKSALAARSALATRAMADMPDDVVYKVTKAFWENVSEAHASAVWMKNAVNLKVALVVVPHGLHPGAARYYKEKGLKVPATYQLGQKWDAKSMSFKTKQ